MKKVLVSVISIIAVVAAFVTLKIGSAVIDINLKSPIGSPIETDISASPAPTPIVLTETVPIALDCRAVTTVTADISVSKDYKILGKSISSDNVLVHAIGDYDTCVNGQITRTTITNNGSKSQKIIVPASSIVINRPRVDTIKSTVEYNRGRVSRWSSMLSDDNSIVDIALKVAQQVVGSSDCINTAWESTKIAVEKSLKDQAANDDIHNVTIEWRGTPDFVNSKSDILTGLKDVTSNVDTLKCISK